VKKAVFGLGNPGMAYSLTRHNVGFEVIDLYRKTHRLRVQGRIESCALVYQEGELLLIKPMTYMNESGSAVRDILARYELVPANALVVYDDLDLPRGRIKILSSGGAGSHKGMSSVLASIGTETIPRLRIGIGREERTTSGRDYVLDRFSPDEWLDVFPALERAGEAIDLFRGAGIDTVMTSFNRRT